MLCIIEAMKLMNEIESDVAGEVVRVFVENGHPVEYGEAALRHPHAAEEITRHECRFEIRKRATRRSLRLKCSEKF